VSEPSPRQVLYALVAGGLVIVVGVLIGGAAVAGLVPLWWTLASSLAVISIGAWSALNWRRTAVVLIAAIGLFVGWAIGTLILAG
jgi:hypothetical protein